MTTHEKLNTGHTPCTLLLCARFIFIHVDAISHFKPHSMALGAVFDGCRHFDGLPVLCTIAHRSHHLLLLAARTHAADGGAVWIAHWVLAAALCEPHHRLPPGPIKIETGKTCKKLEIGASILTEVHVSARSFFFPGKAAAWHVSSVTPFARCLYQSRPSLQRAPSLTW